jgi:hypothetical protein
MATEMQLDRQATARQGMPAGVRRGLIAAVAAALIGALYLIAVRGEALLLDLAALTKYCF